MDGYAHTTLTDVQYVVHTHTTLTDVQYVVHTHTTLTDVQYVIHTHTIVMPIRRVLQMALAYGTVAYCPSHFVNRDTTPRSVEVNYIPTEVGDEVRLIDTHSTYTIAITDHDLIMINMNGEITSRTSLQELTNHRPVALAATDIGCAFITSGKSVVIMTNSGHQEHGSCYVSLNHRRGMIYLLCDTGRVHWVRANTTRGVYGNITELRFPPFDLTNGLANILALDHNTIGVWNEHHITSLRMSGFTTIYSSETTGKMVAKCATDLDYLWLLDDMGDLYKMSIEHLGPLEFVGSGFSGVCVAKIELGFGRIGEFSVVVVVKPDGSVEGRFSPVKLHNLPHMVTVTCSDISVEDKSRLRIKSAVS